MQERVGHPTGGGKAVAKKLHVEITPANWARIKEFMELYNSDSERTTPRFKPADVINCALVEFLRDRRD
jgi:hypothetical protein